MLQRDAGTIDHLVLVTIAVVVLVVVSGEDTGVGIKDRMRADQVGARLSLALDDASGRQEDGVQQAEADGEFHADAKLVTTRVTAMLRFSESAAFMA